MKKESMKIKGNITLEDKVNAIEAITSAYFQNGDYTPYYAEIGEVIAVGKFFIEGYELEEGESIYSMYCSDADFKKMVDAFIHNNNPKSANVPIMSYVREMVKDKLEFVKEHEVHFNPVVNNTLTTFTEFMDVVIDSLGNFSKMNIEALSPDILAKSKTIINKLSDSGIELTKENLISIFREMADFRPDEASQEIIDTKNKKIIELSKYKALWESRNTIK